MKKGRILELIRFLPPENAFFPANTRFSRQRLKARVSMEPAFGYLFARTFSDQKHLLPAEVKEDAIVGAHHSLLFPDRPADDHHIDDALQLMEPEQIKTAQLLQALLLADDISLEKIAGLFGLPDQTVEYFAQLFFDVRDHREEAGYINAIVYPSDPNGTDRPKSFREALFELAHENGADAVLELANLKKGSKMTEATAKRGLSNQLFRDAFRAALMGNYKDRSIPHAVRLLEREENHQSEIPDSEMGLTAMSMTTNILEQIDRIQGQDSPEFKARMEAQRGAFANSDGQGPENITESASPS